MSEEIRSMILKKWDMRFLEMARLVGSWSKDPNSKVGAVIIDDERRVISVGFNGFPRGINDDDRLNRRDEKLSIILHAEENAILTARKDLSGCSIYTSPMPPCSKCCSKIIQCGIRRVVAPENKIERWAESVEIARQMCHEAEVEYITYSI